MKTVAIIGRPNVGKSTLFNRLVGRRAAIESEVPGTTRDRLYATVKWCGHQFEMIDVAGVETGKLNEIKRNMQEGVELSLEYADLILFVVDWTDKDNAADKLIARKLRRLKKNIVLVVNKADNMARFDDITEFQRLGDFEAIPISSISGSNTGDLLDLICKKLAAKTSKTTAYPTNKPNVRLAIMGRPNVGKSTLLNNLIGEKRAIVSEEPGTTRDTVNIEVEHKGKKIEILDTAGIRRRGKIKKETIESFSVLRAWKALRESDVIIIVVDSNEGLVARDANLLGEAISIGKGVILALNKIDLWKENRNEGMLRQLAILQEKLNFAPWLPIVFISAKEGENTKPLLNQVLKVAENRQAQIPEADLIAILNFAKEHNNQLQFTTSFKQKTSAPLSFEVTYGGKKAPHPSQIRYLENKFRDVHPLSGAPIFIDLRQRTPRHRKK